MNPDRTARNPNLMWQNRRLWLIDHGAAFAFQYSWNDVTESGPSRPFIVSEPHVLQSRVTCIDEWDELFAMRLTRDAISAAVSEVPDDFLIAAGVAGETGALLRRRAAYVAYLWKRLKEPRDFFRSLATLSTATVSTARGRPERFRRPAG
jgi:hypothetical protein